MSTNKKPSHKKLKMGSKCKIGKNVIFEGNVRIGNDCIIGNNVILRSVSIGNNSKIEDNSILGYGTITGHYYAQDPKNKSYDKDGYKITIGNNVLIRTGVTIYVGVQIADNCWINHNAIIREDVTILEDTTIGMNTICENKVSIGKRCAIHNHTFVCAESIIESYVFIGPNVTFTNNSPIGHLRDVSSEIRAPKLRLGCAIGGGVTLCPGVEIGQEAIVGAGAVVTKNIPTRVIVAGNPAKIIKDVDPKSFIKQDIRKKYEV